MTRLRDLPAVEVLLQQAAASGMISRFGRPLVLSTLRDQLDSFRSHFDPNQPIPTPEALLEGVQTALQREVTSTLLPVINATGVILHTNLGRAPLSQRSLDAISAVSAGYCSLEFSLETGSRGSRSLHAENLLKKLTGAEAALVVNNCAAALLLALTALSKRKRAVVSRTQLVEIGGGFRVPDVMAQSGAKLVEIGTTNRVHLEDYELALQEPTALVVRAHQSNFRMIGFTSEPNLAEITSLAHAHSTPVLDDLGSGVLVDTARYGIPHEPTVQESIQAGADLVCFSGDKLLGGPQAGILVGKADLIKKLKKHPLARAVRADKLCLAALFETLTHYLLDEAEREIPIWQMISASPESLRTRAEAWAAALETGEVIQGVSTIGGGSLPEETLPTFLLSLNVRSPNYFMALLRRSNPPLIGRVEGDRVLLDPRTVLPFQDEKLLTILNGHLEKHKQKTHNGDGR